MKELFTSGAAAVFGQMREFRRHLHAAPELSFHETATAEYIAEKLSGAGIPFRRIAGTGILACIEGRKPSRRTVVLRADIDALPVHEDTSLPFASKNEGIMHACGHDMHAAGLYGALLQLSGMRDRFCGIVLGLFQPGEECNPGGASLVLADNPFADYDIEAFIGCHIEPQLPVGVFGFRAGKYMASSDELRFTVHGTGGHGAMRQNIKDPVLTAARIISALHAIPDCAPDKSVPTVLSIGRVQADGATNIIPDSVCMEGTLRVFDEAWRAQAKEMIHDICRRISDELGTRTDVDISTGYPCVENNPDLTAMAAELAGKLLGTEAVRHLELRPTAEDFGFYTRLYPSLFYRLGVGQDATMPQYASDMPAGKLHTAKLCPNENGLLFGCAMMTALALKTLGE